MPPNEKAVELAKKAAETTGAKTLELLKKGAGNKQVQKAATKAGEGVVASATAQATKGGTNFLTQRRAERKHKQLAIDLAGQIGGSFSERTVIAGERYFVVWRGNEPIDTFPSLPKNLAPLTERPELQDFQGPRRSPASKAKPGHVQ